jgi:flavin-dependent dehydrogenase
LKVLSDQHYDLAIVGGGPAGASAACAARQLGASVVVIDSIKTERPLEIIPAIALSILRTQGFELDALIAGCARVNRFTSLWADGMVRQRSTISNPFGEDVVVDRCTFAKRMRHAVEQKGTLWHEGRVKQILRSSDPGFVLVNADGSTVRCRKLIVATGRSPFEALKGNKMYLLDRHVAIYPRQKVAAGGIGKSAEFIVESCAGGWWYGLCANGQSAPPVLVTDARDVPARGHWRDWFSAKLQASALLSKQIILKPYATDDFGICSAHTSAHHTPSGEGWSLAGDVRLAIDPLSGNGILRAIQDGVRAVNLLFTKHAPRRRRDFARTHVADWKTTLVQRANAYAVNGRERMPRYREARIPYPFSQWWESTQDQH